MKRFLYVMVGVPASGKTTYIKNNLKNCAIISSDDFIEKKAAEDNITYDEAFPKYVKEAARNIDVSVIEAIANSKNIVWDQTNLTAKKRMNNLKKFPSYYHKVALVFPIPEDLEDRLNSRPGKNIPKHIMQSMIESFEEPTLLEGFDEIRKIQQRALPNDKPLGEPLLKFEDTFSAETVVMNTYFKDE